MCMLGYLLVFNRKSFFFVNLYTRYKSSTYVTDKNKNAEWKTKIFVDHAICIIFPRSLQTPPATEGDSTQSEPITQPNLEPIIETHTQDDTYTNPDCAVLLEVCLPCHSPSFLLFIFG